MASVLQSFWARRAFVRIANLSLMVLLYTIVLQPVIRAEPLEFDESELVFGTRFSPPPPFEIDILWPGDINSDYRVDIFDFNVLKSNFGRGTIPGSHDPFYGKPSTWEQGDFTLDKRTDLPDFRVLKENFGWVGPDSAAPISAASISALSVSAVPEPHTLGMLIIGTSMSYLFLKRCRARLAR